MDELNSIQEKHTAGAQSIGFDYQFYYFMCLALELKHGQKVGFEVKDDIHIDKEDGSTILIQSKHTVSVKEDRTPINLTTLDIDLWKTLSNWIDMVKSNESILSNHYFYLITNKGEGNNEFIEAHLSYEAYDDIEALFELLNKLKNSTQSAEIKKQIINVLSLGKRKAKIFFSRLYIETNIDDIIGKVKIKIFENIKNSDLVDAVFYSLSSNMQVAKYLDIKDRKKFVITFDDFIKRFGKCFRVAFENKPLPKRNFPINLPNNLEEQIFIKQLLDIGEIVIGSPKIIDYTTKMLQSINNLSYWIEQHLVLPTELDQFQKEAILKWDNEFTSKYRKIERKINSGVSIDDLETEIQDLGIEIVDFIRKENLDIAENNLGIELSNGHYYALSDKPDIGWHYDWKRKYKSS